MLCTCRCDNWPDTPTVAAEWSRSLSVQALEGARVWGSRRASHGMRCFVASVHSSLQVWSLSSRRCRGESLLSSHYTPFGQLEHVDGVVWVQPGGWKLLKLLLHDSCVVRFCGVDFVHILNEQSWDMFSVEKLKLCLGFRGWRLCMKWISNAYFDAFGVWHLGNRVWCDILVC